MATNGVSLGVQFSSDNGASWDSNAIYDTSMYQTNQNAFSSPASLSAATYGQITQSVSAASGASVSGTLKLYRPSSSNYKIATFQNGAFKSNNSFYNNDGSMLYRSNASINAFRVFASSGNITSGKVYFYGVSH